MTKIETFFKLLNDYTLFKYRIKLEYLKTKHELLKEYKLFIKKLQNENSN